MVNLTRDEAGICLLAIIKAEIAAQWRCIPNPWVDASPEDLNQLKDKLCSFCDDEILLECPVCGRTQSVPRADYLQNQAYVGHPYTCGSPTCPSHTVMRVVSVNEFKAETDSR